MALNNDPMTQYNLFLKYQLMIILDATKTRELVGLNSIYGLYFILVLQKPGLMSEVTKSNGLKCIWRPIRSAPILGLFAMTPTLRQEEV